MLGYWTSSVRSIGDGEVPVKPAGEAEVDASRIKTGTWFKGLPP